MAGRWSAVGSIPTYSRQYFVPVARFTRFAKANSRRSAAADAFVSSGLDTDTSDVDVLVEAANLNAFGQLGERTWGDRPGFGRAERHWQGLPAVICRFEAAGRLCEVFAQPLPVAKQRGVRHLSAERRLLIAGGDALRDAVRAARQRGLKTEPAFAEVLRLDGDPYDALLLDRAAQETLRQVVARWQASLA